MAFPIIPRLRSGATGNPTSLELGELATNTATGELFLGGDGGVMLLNPPTSAGTTVTEHTGDGSTVAFAFTGYNGTADGGYLVSVGGIDQPPSKYSVSNTNGGTITFVEAPVAGELISIRAIVAGSGGGGNATEIRGTPIGSPFEPVNGDLLKFDGTSWLPFSGLAIPKWKAWTNYEAGDLVCEQGIVFQCLQSNPGNVSPLDSTFSSQYWGGLIGMKSSYQGPQDSSNIAGWVKVALETVGGAWVPYYL